MTSVHGVKACHISWNFAVNSGVEGMNPCRHCEERHQDCHSNCIHYDNYKEAVEKAREARKLEREAINFLNRPASCNKARKRKKAR